MVDKYMFSVLCTLHIPLNICYKKRDMVRQWKFG